MYDADYERYKEELKKDHEAVFGGSEGVIEGFDPQTGRKMQATFVTRHGGEMSVHSDGVKRDTTEGKTLYTLMFPKGVPMKDQLIVRIAELYTRGGARYGLRNWENSEGEDTREHHTEALWRHFMKFFFDVQDGEDHAAAIVWNINAVELTRRKIAEREQDEKEAAAHKAEAESAWPDVQSPKLTEDMKGFNDRFSLLLANLHWESGDQVTEAAEDIRNPGTWTYSEGGDVWCFSGFASARSLPNLVREFGPLKVTHGKNAGWILHKNGTIEWR